MDTDGTQRRSASVQVDVLNLGELCKFRDREGEPQTSLLISYGLAYHMGFTILKLPTWLIDYPDPSIDIGICGWQP